MAIPPKVRCKEIIKVHIGYNAGISAERRFKELHCLKEEWMAVCKSVYLTMKQNPFAYAFREVLILAPLNEIANKITYLKLPVSAGEIYVGQIVHNSKNNSIFADFINKKHIK